MDNQEGIHTWRWRLLALWIVIFTAICFFALSQNAHNIHEINKDKASIHQLEITNCSLKQFLLTARRARLRASKTESGKKRATDLQAARGYLELAARFHTGAGCVRVVDGNGN